MAITGLDAKVTHEDLVLFADSHVNLRRDDVAEYREQVNRLREKLASYIAEHPAYDLVKMLHSGSVAKGTALKTIDDMDVAVYVEATKAPGQEQGLLSWLMERLREAYGNVLRADQFSIRNHCVRISFRGTGLDVDVVPVLYEGENDDYGYLVAADTGDRVRTSVTLHKEFVRERKRAQPTDFAQIVRFVKWWVRQRRASEEGFRCKSFMVELIVAHLADEGMSCSDYPEALQNVFAYIARSELTSRIVFSDYSSAGAVPPQDGSPIRIYDPVNQSNNVASRYSDADRQAIVEAAKDALDSITFARSAATKQTAVNQWREVFGPGFDA